MTFAEMQEDFVRRRKGVPSLPITGVVNYAVAAVASLFVPAAQANLVLTICFWAIPPVAALLGRLRGEDMSGTPDNPLFRLSKLARVMVLTTWAIHVPVWIYAPSLFPLTVGIAFGLHWAIFSWCVGHPVGLVHLAVRTSLVLAAWFLFPGNRMGAVSLAVSLSYLLSVWQLSRIDWDRLARDRRRGDPGGAGQIR